MSKIIIVSPAYPLRGGIANFSEALASTLQAQGHDVAIVSYSLQYPGFLFPGKTQFVTDPPSDSIRDLPIHPLINSINPWTWFRAAQWIVASKPDYVLISHFQPFLLPSSYCTTLFLKWSNVPAFTLFHKAPFCALLMSMMHICRGSIGTSQRINDWIVQHAPTHPVCEGFHPPYDCAFGQSVESGEARLRLGLEKNGKYILFFGLIRPYKGLDLLLEALTDPHLEALDIQLVIAGECYSDERQLHQRLATLNLKTRVITHIRFIPRDEVSYYFSAADIVVQPYTLFSGSSGVTALAYNFLKPVIVTNIGGLPDQVLHEKTGFVVERDPTAIANAIVTFFQRSDSAEFAKNISQYNAEHSWAALAKRIDAFCLGNMR